MDNVHPFIIIAPILIIVFFWWTGSTVRRTEEKAKQGDVESQYWLARYYGDGLEGGYNDTRIQASPPNYVTAYAWAHIAELNGYELNRVAPLKRGYGGNLTYDEMSKAQVLLAEILEKNPKVIGEKLTATN